MDRAVEEFFNYLKESGLYDNSVIVLYGDHYGISNSRNKNLAELLGKDSASWSNFDNAALQRVPYMIHIPGQSKGGINHTYGGQVDALPTLLHLLGVDTSKYIQLGQDLFSKQNEQLVAFRDGDFVTPEYTYYGGVLYSNSTGMAIPSPSASLQKQVDEWKAKVDKQLSVSDQINNGDLLRFYAKSGLKEVDPDNYDYKNALQKLSAKEKELGADSTSVFSKMVRNRPSICIIRRPIKNTKKWSKRPINKLQSKVPLAFDRSRYFLHKNQEVSADFLFLYKNFILYSNSPFILDSRMR